MSIYNSEYDFEEKDQFIKFYKNKKIILELNKNSFLKAGINSYINPLNNNFFHKISQTVNKQYKITQIRNMNIKDGCINLSGAIVDKNDEVIFNVIVSFGKSLNIKINVDSTEINRLYFSFIALEKERFYGFGEQFTHFDLTEKKFPLISSEQGIGRGRQPFSSIVDANSGSTGNEFTTYAPMAIAVTSQNRALFINNSRFIYADVKYSEKDSVIFEIWDNCIEIDFWRGNSILDAIENHTEKTGRYKALPQWAHGTIVGMRGGKDKVESVLRKCEEHNVPVSAIWIEDWVGRRGKNAGPPLWWNWVPNEECYPDFKNWVEQLYKKGIKTLTYFNPFIADDEMFQQCRTGLEKGYFVKKLNGEAYHRKTGMGYGYYMIDFSNEEAFNWMANIMIDTVKDLKIRGWMADYGEYLPMDAIMFNKENGEEYHQKYAEDWIRLNRIVAQKSGLEGDMLIFNRCGFSHTNKDSIAFWAGDQNVTFDEDDGLGSLIVGLLSGGVSGIAVNHSDIGGHTTIVNPIMSMTRSKELFWRWAEIAIFTPIFRTHEGTLTDENHQFYSSEDTLELYGLTSRMHLALNKYFEYLENEASEKGYPLIRPTVLYDEDVFDKDLRYQFMLGEDIIVFPCLNKNQKRISGYLPKGKWYYPWDSSETIGNQFIKQKIVNGKPVFYIRKDGNWSERLIEIFEMIKVREKEVLDKLEKIIL